MMNSQNPRTEIAALTAELDSLTAEFKAALEQENTTPGGTTGIERLSGLMDRAKQLVQRREAIGDQPAIMDRYVATIPPLMQARAALEPYPPLTSRVQALLRDIEAAEAAAQERLRVATMTERSSYLRAKEAKIDPVWLEEVRRGAL